MNVGKNNIYIRLIKHLFNILPSDGYPYHYLANFHYDGFPGGRVCTDPNIIFLLYLYIQISLLVDDQYKLHEEPKIKRAILKMKQTLANFRVCIEPCRLNLSESDVIRRSLEDPSFSNTLSPFGSEIIEYIDQIKAFDKNVGFSEHQQICQCPESQICDPGQCCYSCSEVSKHTFDTLGKDFSSNPRYIHRAPDMRTK
jgi:hypothetical protein